MKYLYNYGIDITDIELIKENASDEVYSDLSFFEGLVSQNIEFLKNFGIQNYGQAVVKYPEIFLRDTSSLQNVLSKFDREDLIERVAKNVAVLKKMVDYVDNN